MSSSTEPQRAEAEGVPTPWGRRIVGWLRDAWLMGGVTLLLLVLLELVLAATPLGAPQGEGKKQKVKSRARADTYQGEEWPVEYFAEFHQLDRSLWYPYVYWRRSPFEGETIRVDQSGRRITPQLNSPPGAPGILFFGGSTMWGTGARDQHTIPAEVASQMAALQIPIQAENFGEAGYVSTQELIAFHLSFREVDGASAAVFYSGVNDAFSVYQHRTAGLTHNEGNRVSEFGLSVGANRHRLFRAALFAWINDRAISRAVRRLTGRGFLESGGGDAGGSGPWRNPIPEERWAAEVAKCFRLNIEAEAAIADARGVRALFYLQPTLFQKPSRTPYESKVAEKYPGLEKVVLDCYAAIRSEMSRSPVGGRFIDLSGFFAEDEAPIFIDWCHVGETGSRRIAGAMSQDLARLLPTAAAKP